MINPNNKTPGKCPDCGSENWRKSKTRYICKNCGYIFPISNNVFKRKAINEFIPEPYSAKNKKKKEKKAIKNRIHTRSERDQLLRINVERTLKRIERSNPPRFVTRIVKNISLYPVHYLFIEKKLPEKGNKVSDLRYPIPFPLEKALIKRGIKHLYKFQEKAIELVLLSNNVVITAPTGSGKTEAFVLPILIKSIENPEKKPNAIIIYPNKALARDQYLKIKKLTDSVGLRVSVFDGDTDREEKKSIISNPPNILITNPDMIHYHLMNTLSFKEMISKVSIIVFDEVHQSVGAFGTSIHYIVKRIRRFNPDFQIIAASATIGNPTEFCEKLFDAEFIEVTAGEIRLAPTHIIMVYPRSVSHYTVIANLARISTQERSKTIIFSNTHKGAETLFQVLKRMDLKPKIHRGGLTKKKRMEIEKEFREGELSLLIATPTLELGIDIGEVDSVISEIVDVTRFVQRIGRGGRKGQDSLGVIVLRSDDPISNYYSHHPEDYFGDIANAYVEPLNELVAEKQLLAAAMDAPLFIDEFPKLRDLIERMVREGKLWGPLTGPLQVSPIAINELNNYNIRGIGENIKIYYNNKKIGERALPMALRELHPGAIYLLGGESYISEILSLEGSRKFARVRPIPFEGKRTEPLREMSPKILKILEKKNFKGIEVVYCELLLTEFIWGYSIIDVFSGKIIENRILDEVLEYSFRTKGFVFKAPEPIEWVKEHFDEPLIETLGGTYHAIEHVLIEGGNSLTGGGANEIGGVSVGTTGLIVIYDGAPGGSGLTKLLYDKFDTAIDRAKRIMEECSCQSRHGCPKCTFSYQCGNNNRPLERIGAIKSLELIGKQETKIIEIPSGKYYI